MAGGPVSRREVDLMPTTLLPALVELCAARDALHAATGTPGAVLSAVLRVADALDYTEAETSELLAATLGDLEHEGRWAA